MREYDRIKTVINSQTGEIVEETEHTIIKRGRKDLTFVKVFLKDLHLMRDLRAGAYQITFELLQRMNYKNEVYIGSGFKADMSKSLGYSVGYIEHTLKDLVKEQILFRNGRGEYIVNPHIFGRGDWTTVKEVRMKLKYSREGREIDVEADDFEYPPEPMDGDGKEF